MTTASQPGNGAPSVLICEDDADARAIIRIALASIGMRVIEAEDGTKAKELFRSQKPDLVVSDIMMPGVTGIELTEWIKNQPGRFVPVLLLTALTEIDNRVDGLQSGADDYLTKPFDYRELQARARALMRIKTLTDSLADRSRQLELAQDELVARERKIAQMELAGAAVHNLGQPVTSILLHCGMLEKGISALHTRPKDDAAQLGEIGKGMGAIRGECEAIKDILTRLCSSDPERKSDYLGLSISDLGATGKSFQEQKNQK